LDDARKQEKEEEEERSSIKVQYEISNIVELKRNKDSQSKFGYFNESYE
jgi:hypothetical protein